MAEYEPYIKGVGSYTPQQRPIVQGNTCDERPAVDELPDPSNPLAIDASGLDGLDSILRCVAVSANTLRDMGYPEATAWQLMLAAKHVKRCMLGVDKADREGMIIKSSKPEYGTRGFKQEQGKRTWSRKLVKTRCCKTVLRNGQPMEV